MNTILVIGVSLILSQMASAKNVICLLNEADTAVEWSVRYQNALGAVMY